jgi:hypothetical protein
MLTGRHPKHYKHRSTIMHMSRQQTPAAERKAGLWWRSFATCDTYDKCDRSLISIVTREDHISTVLGSGLAAERIHSRQRIRVDGHHGVVTNSEGK